MTWHLFWHHPELWTVKHTEDFWRAWDTMTIALWMVGIKLFVGDR